jgi:hypothetical protein
MSNVCLQNLRMKNKKSGCPQAASSQIQGFYGRALFLVKPNGDCEISGGSEQDRNAIRNWIALNAESAKFDAMGF